MDSVDGGPDVVGAGRRRAVERVFYVEAAGEVAGPIECEGELGAGAAFAHREGIRNTDGRDFRRVRRNIVGRVVKQQSFDVFQIGVKAKTRDRGFEISSVG